MTEINNMAELAIEYNSLKSNFEADITSTSASDTKRLIGSTKSFAVVEEFSLSGHTPGEPVLTIRARNKVLPGRSFVVEFETRVRGYIVSKIKAAGPFLFGKLISFENTHEQEIAYITVPHAIQQLTMILPYVTTKCPLKSGTQTLEHLFLKHSLSGSYHARLTLSQNVIACIDPWLLLAGMALLMKRFGESEGGP